MICLSNLCIKYIVFLVLRVLSTFLNSNTKCLLAPYIWPTVPPRPQNWGARASPNRVKLIKIKPAIAIYNSVIREVRIPLKGYNQGCADPDPWFFWPKGSGSVKLTDPYGFWTLFRIRTIFMKMTTFFRFLFSESQQNCRFFWLFWGKFLL